MTLRQTRYGSLLGAREEKNHARLWWRNPLSWSGELQRRQPFRQSTLENRFYLVPNGMGKLQWNTYDDQIKEFTVVDCIKKYQNLKLHQNCKVWFNADESERYQEIQDVLDSSQRNVILNYGEVSLPNLKEGSTEQYYYHPVLGIFLNKKL
ncbi:hypothetical protein [Acinetobacter guillouiae]|uniref:hypothetical protein n=1 Tax=Acinetobacter guillouiae TaxID=106649 RepID=UPI003CFE5E80